MEDNLFVSATAAVRLVVPFPENAAIVRTDSTGGPQ